MMGLDGIDAERAADVSCREQAGSGLEHPIGIDLGERHAFMEDSLDLEAALQQFAEEFLTRHWIVGQIVVRLLVAVKRNRVFDVVLCEMVLWG